MTTPIDADLLMRFIRSEAEERASVQKPDDDAVTHARDLGFYEGLEIVTTYIIAATGRDRKVA